MTTTFSSKLKFNARIQKILYLTQSSSKQIWISNSGSYGQRLLRSPQPSDRLWGTPSLIFNGFRGFFRVKCCRSVDHSPRITTVLRMSGAIPLLLTNASMAWTGKTVEQTGWCIFQKHLLWYISRRQQKLRICKSIIVRVVDNAERIPKEAVLS